MIAIKDRNQNMWFYKLFIDNSKNKQINKFTKTKDV